jgi:hypothetical protein
MVKEVVYYILHALALKEEGDNKLAIGGGEGVLFGWMLQDCLSRMARRWDVMPYTQLSKG